MQLNWHQASGDVAKFVSGFVERRDADRAGATVELPLALPLLHLTLGAPYVFEEALVRTAMPRACLWGSSLEAREAVPGGPLHAFVAVLTFRGAELICPDIARIAVGRRIDLEEQLDPAGRNVLAAMFEAKALADRAHIFEDFLRLLSAARSALASKTILDVADAIAAHRMVGSVQHIAGRSAMSERTLRNRFVREVGVSPKRLLRVARFNRLVRSLHPGPWGGTWKDDAALEYFDEAHLCREFKSMSGLSPGSYVRRKRLLRDPLVHGYLI